MLKAVYKIRVQIENYRAPNKVAQCFKYENYVHHAKYYFIQVRSVGCGENCDAKTV